MLEGDPLLTNTDYSVSARGPFPGAVIMWPQNPFDMRKASRGQMISQGNKSSLDPGPPRGRREWEEGRVPGTGHQDQDWLLASPLHRGTKGGISQGAGMK